MKQTRFPTLYIYFPIPGFIGADSFKHTFFFQPLHSAEDSLSPDMQSGGKLLIGVGRILGE